MLAKLPKSKLKLPPLLELLLRNKLGLLKLLVKLPKIRQRKPKLLDSKQKSKHVKSKRH